MRSNNCCFAAAPKERSSRRSGPAPGGQLSRLECRRSFTFQREWNGSWYTTKQVRPIFIDGPDEIVVVTVYVYYFSGER